MKKFQSLIALLFAFITTVNSFAQTEDSTVVWCKVNGESVAQTQAVTPQSSFPTATIVTCSVNNGTFRIYYQDFLTGLNQGFADPTLGSQRRNTYCALLNYISTVINLHGQTIDIFVDQSYSASNPAPAGTAVLASAAPFNPAGTYGASAGFFGGNFYHHVYASADPDVNQYDGYLRVNFDFTYNPTVACDYWDNYTNTSTSCRYDLYSILLHEMMHVMGWFSAVGEDATANHYLAIKSNTSNIASFSKLDSVFLYSGDVRTPSGFVKLVTISPPALNSAITTVTNILRQTATWMTLNGAPKNDKVADGYYVSPYGTASGTAGVPSSYLSHLDLAQWSLYRATQFSPGYQPKYVIGPTFSKQEQRRTFSLQELRYLKKLGYSYDPTFASSTSLSSGVITNSTLLNSNSPPHRSNYASANTVYFPASPFTFPNGSGTTDKAGNLWPETKTADYTLTNNNAPGGSITTSLVMNVNTFTNVTDLDGQSVGIYPGSLYGIRGVTTGGNNHNCLVQTGTNTITYTPPPGYIGRAEFCFNLWDGLEIGAKKLITIDVGPGAYTIPAGNELLINGTFEDGSEVRTISQPTIVGTTIDNWSYITELHMGHLFTGGMPYSHLANKWSWNGGVLRKESSIGCVGAPAAATNSLGSFGHYATFGLYTSGFNPLQAYPTAIPSASNECYAGNSSGYVNAMNFTLMNPLATCKNYQIEFDCSFTHNSYSLGQAITFTLEAITSIVPDYSPTTLNVNPINYASLQAIPITVMVTALTPNVTNSNWQHVTATFVYCGSPTRNLLFNGYGYKSFDNFSIKQLTTPLPPLVVSAINSSTLFCPNTTATLTAIALNSQCSTNFTWQPMGSTAASVAVTPTSVSQTYTVLANDGCRTGSAIVTPTPSPAGTFTLPSPQCLGTTVSNLASYLGTVYPSGGVFSGTGVQTIPGTPPQYDLVLNPNLIAPGIYTLNYTYTNPGSNCTSIYTGTVSIFSVPNPTISATVPCISSGQSTTLSVTSTVSPVSYTWMPGSYTATSVVVSPTVNTAYTVTASNGVCSANKTYTVNVFAPVTFTNVPANWCTYQSIFYLENYLAAGTPTGGVFTGAGTYTALVGAQVLTSVYVNPSLFTPGTYTYNYTYTAPSSTACTVSNQFTVNVVPGFSLTNNGPVTYCSNLAGGAVISVTATPSTGVTYTWAPGSLVGQTQTVTPSASTYYTVTASSAQCSFTNIMTVVVSSVCCTNTITAFSGSILPQGTINGPIVINNNVTVPSGTTTTFSGEVLFASNVQVTVAGGAGLVIDGAHLHACSADMWQGIVVNDGGNVKTAKNTLFEDAIVGIDISSHLTSTITVPYYILHVDYTIFNKNNVGIKISNYVRNTSSGYPFYIGNCVFTSRTFTYTSINWPQATVTDVRNVGAGTPTTGLASPYNLESAALANQLNPYSSITASVGVEIDNCGYSSGGNYYGVDVGDGVNEANFNLFDNLLWGINGVNSVIGSFNNAFQNITIYHPPHHISIGGTAISSQVFNNFNVYLNLCTPGTYSTNYSLGNRFWNCYAGVGMTNVNKFDCKYATFRSTQSSTNTAVLPGNLGIQATTNRFEFNISNCNFNNINTAINLPISTGTYTWGANTYTGVLAGNCSIINNYFGPQISSGTAVGTNYVNYAVNISAPNTASWNIIAGAPMSISSNTINRVFRGVWINGFISTSVIETNTISLLDDNVFLTSQCGVLVANSSGFTVRTNSVTGANTSNTGVALIYSGSNSSHAVTCNTTVTGYTGFQFDGSHGGTNLWKGNVMQTQANGFYLTNGGAIGTQGGTSNPIDNQWSGSWTGKNQTIVDGTSNGTNSKFFTRVGGVYQPTLNAGPVSFNYNTFGYVTTTAGSYTCGSGGGGCPTCRLQFIRNTSLSTQNVSANSRMITNLSNAQYVAITNDYRYLMAHDSIRNSDSVYINFCNNLAGTSVDKLMQAENSFYTGDASTASGLNSAVTATNDVEANYKQYYGLYNQYATGNFTASDSTNLFAFAGKCPGINGSCVYQARALYNSIYNVVYTFTDNCPAPGSERKLVTGTFGNVNSSAWNVELYPNPAFKHISIVTTVANEKLHVSIKDVDGRILLSQNLVTRDFIATLDLNLVSGVYLVTIKNSLNENVTKKLVIAD